MQINSVLSIFNFTTFGEFYHYLLDNKLYEPTDSVNYIYNMISPVHIAALALPVHLKLQGIEGLESVIRRMNDMGFKREHMQTLVDAKKWVLAENTWDQHKKEFQEETNRLDNIREEKFADVFPELAELME